MDKDTIVAAGAGRMGRGIALTFTMAGHPVHLVDLKDRTPDEFAAYSTDASREIRSTLTMLADIGLFSSDRIESIAERVEIHPFSRCADAFAHAAVVFEAVPETLDAKREAFAVIGAKAPPDAIVASTTSTILSDDLAPMVDNPVRF